MAQAQFHKSQRVFVKPVGTWAIIEKVIPHWVKNVSEPLKIMYECGLGREFTTAELVSVQDMQAQQGPGHDPDHEEDDDIMLEQWRVLRRQSKWRAIGVGGADSHPGTYPVVVTDESERGGWRVPSAEYDRDPQRVEYQARVIMTSPDLMRLARRLSEFATAHPDQIPTKLVPIVKRSSAILRYIYQVDDAKSDAMVAAE